TYREVDGLSIPYASPLPGNEGLVISGYEVGRYESIGLKLNFNESNFGFIGGTLSQIHIAVPSDNPDSSGYNLENHIFTGRARIDLGSDTPLNGRSFGYAFPGLDGHRYSGIFGAGMTSISAPSADAGTTPELGYVYNNSLGDDRNVINIL